MIFVDRSLRMVSSSSAASHIKMTFSDGGIGHMKSFLEKSLLNKAWEKVNPVLKSMPMVIYIFLLLIIS